MERFNQYLEKTSKMDVEIEYSGTTTRPPVDYNSRNTPTRQRNNKDRSVLLPARRKRIPK